MNTVLTATVLRILLLSILIATPLAYSQQISGRLGIDSRYFVTHTEAQNAILIEPEWYGSSTSNNDSVTFTLFARADSLDSARSHIDIREANWLHVGDSWELRTGISKVFWGVTESNHLVDIINQTDAVESADGEQKLGQPMIQLSTINDWGVVEAYILPYFRKRTFAGVDGYLNGSLDIDSDNALFEANEKQQHIDYALRYSHSVNVFDLGVSWFKGTNREAQFWPSESQTQQVFAPYYDQIEQVGVDLQATVGDWLLKLETLARQDSQQDFTAFTAGFEYTWVGIGDSALDLGLLSEWSQDSRQQLAPTTLQKDVFLGGRLTFNDSQSTELLVGFSQDIDNRKSYLAFAEGSRRIGNNWKTTLDARFFHSDNTSDPMYFIKDDNYVSLSLEYFY